MAIVVLAVLSHFIYNSSLFKVFAEQSPGTPESGTTSRIKAIYDSLKTLGYGSESAGSWGDWGAYWNRIRSSAESSTNFIAQSLEEYDDYKYGGSHGAGEGGDEEAAWELTAANVYRDSRTGLYWSNSLGSNTNSFSATHADCPFFAEDPRGSSYDGSDPDCGNAINACATLNLEAVTGEGVKGDWYLPSVKEMMQACLDGIYNQTNTGWVTLLEQWSSSEGSAAGTVAWSTFLREGSFSEKAKGNSYATRCVRRD